jgi:hypothetical protein
MSLSPYTLMGVCRAWRRVAIACSALWSTLHIGYHLEPPQEIAGNRCQAFIYKDRILTTPVAVRKALRRSRGRLLNVTLSVRDVLFCRDCFTRCLGLVGQQLEQWQSLVFKISENARVNLDPILVGSLSNLRTVLICNHSSQLVAVLASRAPTLHTIVFPGLFPRNLIPYIGQEFWPRVHKLKLGYSWCTNDQFQNFTSILAACTMLRSLELGGSIVARVHSLPNSWPPSLPNLARMRYKTGLAGWALLSGMTITTLYIAVLHPGGYKLDDWNSRYTQGTKKIYLPKLKHLTCEGLRTILCAADLFDAPTIVDLVVVDLTAHASGLVESEDLNMVGKDTSLHPQNVLFHWRASRPSAPHPDLIYVLHLLRHFHDTQCLTLRGIPCSDVEVFARSQTQKLCPRLNHITWWLISGAGDVKELQTGLFHVIRKCFGGPHTRWTVERISRAEDDRTFLHVRAPLALKVRLELRTTCSQYCVENTRTSYPTVHVYWALNQPTVHKLIGAAKVVSLSSSRGACIVRSRESSLRPSVLNLALRTCVINQKVAGYVQYYESDIHDAFASIVPAHWSGNTCPPDHHLDWYPDN